MTNEELARHWELLAMKEVGGKLYGVQRFMYTHGLLVGITEHTYETRYCYPLRRDALAALVAWDGQGDPPGPWIKQKGGVERDNPNLKGIPITQE